MLGDIANAEKRGTRPPQVMQMQMRMRMPRADAREYGNLLTS
jgi:hypothetical protein